MHHFNNVNIDILVKLSVALSLGALLGLERFFAHKPASMRTYSLVSMGAALFVIISELVYRHYGLIGAANFDPFRMAAQVVVGIGFLGAGMIILHGDRVIGLTTATGFWVSAGIGIAVGFGLYSLAGIATVLTLFIFIVFWLLENKLRRMPYPIDSKLD